VLTHVGRRTPGGEYLRRFWHPVALASELGDVPLPLRVLAEDLVLFRDGRGRLGLLHRHCSHRGASLEFGVVAERGIRCCYHGWVYDVDGTILETPAEPESRVRLTRCHGAYPTLEADGLVFAYLGPAEEKPPFPRWDTLSQPADNELAPFKLSYPCNWLQVHENTADPMHIPFLHGRVSGIQFGPGFSALPALSFADTPIGMVVASTRFWDGRIWIRTADLMRPNVAQYPPAFETGEQTRALVDAWATRWIVPRDDTSCWVIGYRHFNAALDPRGQGRRDRIGLESVDFDGQVARVGADRQRMPGDFEAMVGQGPISIHANENLVASDRGVVRLRARLRREIDRVRSGHPVTGPGGGDAPIPTYTAEFALAAGADPGPDALERLGDRALALLLASAAETPDIRAKTVARHLEETLSCL
jgi:nitrite reductase/ring-hydroxylating ferredoxin subunit